jgi:hypothetical protein
MTMDLSKTDKAYLAGIFDFHGSFSLMSSEGKGGYIRCELCVCVSNKNAIDWLIKKIGGGIKISSPKKISRTRRSPVYWMCLSKDIKTLCEEVLPYLKIKKRQAELLIEFRKTVKNGVGLKKTPFTEYDKQKRRLLKKEMEEINDKDRNEKWVMVSNHDKT